MPFAERSAVTLAYESYGDPDHAAIVLIRGLGTQLIEWPRSLVDALVGAGLRVVVFDNRDCGLSSKIENAASDPSYRMEDMAADVIGLLDHLGIARAHILGISMGGIIAQHVALGFPERTISLISVMSGTGNPDLPPMAPDQRELLTRVAENLEQAIEFDAQERQIWGSPGYPVAYSERLAAARRAAERCYYPAGAQRQMQAVIADGSRMNRLATLDVPTLIIHGADDTLVSVDAGRDTARCVPGAELEIVPGMGHNIPAGLGGWLAERVARFVDQALA